MPDSIVLLSGGMDSTTLLALAIREGRKPHTLAVDYGQRHVRELQAAAAVAAHYGVPHDVVDLQGVGALLGGNALTDDAVDVPRGHYTAPTMRSTVVPNRNAIMLSVAVAVAAARGAAQVETAVHAGDHPVYPDCRPEFVSAINYAARIGTDGIGDVGVSAPFVNQTKADIARLASALEAPLELSWSCYEGGEHHCGACGTCVERREAFALAELEDPTDYAQVAA